MDGGSAALHARADFGLLVTTLFGVATGIGLRRQPIDRRIRVERAVRAGNGRMASNGQQWPALASGGRQGAAMARHPQGECRDQTRLHVQKALIGCLLPGRTG